MKKDFLPDVIDENPPGGMLHLAYGITEERRLELANAMTAISQKPALIPMWYRIQQLGEIAENKNEFAFCIMADTIFLMSSKRHQILF